jgi:uncharacterized protein (DUF1697 family)
MTTYVALLRAVNVGGTGRLSMADLRRLCEDCGFCDVATYIQSGNVVFRSRLGPAAAQARLAKGVAARMGKPHGVILRTAAEMAAVAAANPFPKALPNRVIAFFFVEAAPSRDAVDDVVPPAGEELVLRGRELFVHYPEGMGRSRLRIPFAKEATGRNLATVRKLAEMAGALR